MSNDLVSMAPVGEQGASSAEMVRAKARMDNLKRRLSGGASDEKRLMEAAQDFEAIFMNQMWKQMRATVPKEGYLHSRYEDHYLSMFDQEMSRKMAKAGGIGLADMLYSQLQDKLKSASRSTAPGGPVRQLGVADRLGGIPATERGAAASVRPVSVAVEEAVDPARLSGEELLRKIEELADEIETGKNPRRQG